MIHVNKETHMSELVLVVDITLKPETEEKVLDLLSRLIEPTRQEEGCLYYSFYKDNEQDHKYAMIERWRSPEDLEKHFQSEHMLEHNDTIKELVKDVKMRKFSDAFPQ